MSDESIDLARQKRLPFKVNRGQEIDYTILVNNADGTPYDFTDHTAEFFVYNSYNKTDTPEYEIDVALSLGSMRFTHDAITRKKENFVYKLWITDADGYRQPWTNGPFLVLDSEVNHEDGEDTIIISPGGDEITLIISPDIQDYPVEVKDVTATTYTVLEEDNGKYIRYTNASDITITLPNDLSDSHLTQHVKKGTGDLIFVATGTIESIGDTIEDQFAAAVAIHEGANVWGLFGKLT